MKKISILIIAILIAGIFAGCGSSANSGSSTGGDSQALKIGASLTPHSELLAQVKPILANEGIALEVVVIDDFVTPNIALAEGSLDVNFFQHLPYLEDYNRENNTDLVSIGMVHYEPFAIYAGRTKALAELPDGAKIAVPNDVTNEARALVLLQDAGLIELEDGVGIKATTQNIKENSRNFQIIEVAAEQLVRSLPDVDIAVINGNYAISGNLSVRDALVVESEQSIAAVTYANIVAARADNQNDPAVLKLISILQSDEIRSYIEDNYAGSVVPIK